MRLGIPMSDLIDRIQKYPLMTSVEKAQFLKLFTDNGALTDQIYHLAGQGLDRLILRVLTDGVKKKQVAEKLYFLENKYAKVKGMLASDDPKVRKNAAEFIGACCAANYGDILTDTLEKEDTEFVRPSILLALGKTGDPKIHDYLQHYSLKNTVEKHRNEEKAALSKALSLLLCEDPKVVMPSTEGFPLLLTCAAGHLELTREEFEENEINYKDYPLLDNTLIVRTTSYKDVFACRTFYEAFVWLGKCPPTLHGLESFFHHPKFEQTIQKLYHGKQLSYRIEVKGSRLKHEERIKIIETAAKAIDIPSLVNSPSSYSFELRIIAGQAQFLLLIKPSPALDQRFSYRLKTLPASIHPVTAACIMRYIFPYLKRNADVLDPFCGSGTILFERSKIKGYASLTGTDNKKYAVVSAKQNETAAKTGAKFILTDILAYKPEKRYDEIISNMPFGHRVGSHEDNTQLYLGFVKALHGLLRPKGTAFLFTNDKKLLKDLINQNGQFSIRDETVFNSGNLHPSLFIIERSDK